MAGRNTNLLPANAYLPFTQELLGIFLDGLIADAFPDAREIAQASAASGVVQDDTDEAAERANAVASRLVRDARFSKDVRHAYGHRCAMCGLGLKLVVGAHICPVEAPKSPDKVWNGLALCENHHAAFDKYFIWIDPTTYAVRLRSDILEIAKTDAAAQTFAQSTRSMILLPKAVTNRPRPAMFDRRYAYYESQYNWV